jgi:hypothetical protein
MEKQIDSRVLATLVASAAQLASADILTRPNPAEIFQDQEATLVAIDHHFTFVIEAYERRKFLLGS